MIADRDLELVPVDVGQAFADLLGDTVDRVHDGEFAAPAGTDLDTFAAKFRAAWTAGNEWLPCHCGATRVTVDGECRDCTAVTAAGGAR